MVAWCKRTNQMTTFIGVGVFLMACAAFKSGAKTAIEVAVATCIAEHPEAATEPELAKVCQYAEEYAPIVEQLLAARKRGLVRMAAQRSAAPPADAVVLVLVAPLDAGAKDAAK